MPVKRRYVLLGSAGEAPDECVRRDGMRRESPYANDGPVMIARDQMAMNQRAGSGKELAGLKRLNHNAIKRRNSVRRSSAHRNNSKRHSSNNGRRSRLASVRRPNSNRSAADSRRNPGSSSAVG